jgi:hypothetical protein
MSFQNKEVLQMEISLNPGFEFLGNVFAGALDFQMFGESK